MALKVIRYKNYGLYKGDYIERYKNLKMYWSFYELSNGNIIEFYLREQWWKDEFVNIIQDYTLANTYSKNGEKIREYKFGMDISDWVFIPLEEADIKPANIKEVMCINNFFYKHLYEKREQESDVIVVSTPMMFNMNEFSLN
tara:strand:+ start:2352 stop:2777 length:426 start_codon:yes stop_codon:yes gene_type:complete